MRLILFIFLVSFASCQKCQTCKQEIITKLNSGHTQTTESTFEACGQELRSIRNKATYSTMTVNGTTARVTTKTVCY
jgi:hypothetical protein